MYKFSILINGHWRCAFCAPDEPWCHRELRHAGKCKDGALQCLVRGMMTTATCNNKSVAGRPDIIWTSTRLAIGILDWPDLVRYVKGVSRRLWAEEYRITIGLYVCGNPCLGCPGSAAVAQQTSTSASVNDICRSRVQSPVGVIYLLLFLAWGSHEVYIHVCDGTQSETAMTIASISIRELI